MTTTHDKSPVASHTTPATVTDPKPAPVTPEQVRAAISSVETDMGSFVSTPTTRGLPCHSLVMEDTEAGRVYRALPNTHPDGNGEEHLTWAVNHLRWRESMFIGNDVATIFAYLAGVFGVAAPTSAYLLAVPGLLGPLLGMAAMMSTLSLLMTVSNIVLRRREDPTTRAAIETIFNADPSTLVEVVNPDPTTGLLLSGARAHLKTVVGDATQQAYTHYYDLVVEAAQTQAGQAVTPSRSDQWASAWTTWCGVDDAWTDLMCDPFKALTHSQLLDVTLPRTAAFITAYTEAREVLDGHTATTTPADLSRMLRLVKAVETAWVEARDHAEHVGYLWLPEPERVKAELAAKLLVLAVDETASMPERANAATRAGRLLTQITTVRLPKRAATELEHIARKALPSSSILIEASQVDAVVSEPILVPVAETQPV